MHPIADFWWCHRQDAVWCKGIPPNDKIVKLTKCAATLGNKTGTEVGKIFLHVTWIMPGLDLKLPILDCPWLGGKSKFKFIKILNYILLLGLTLNMRLTGMEQTNSFCTSSLYGLLNFIGSHSVLVTQLGCMLYGEEDYISSRWGRGGRQ